MEVVHRLLTDGGLQMVHTIGRGTSTRPGDDDPWILKYIFPNGQLPGLAQIAAAAEGLFIVEDVHNFGPYYDLTLMSWHKNFQEHWPSLSKDGDQYDERFKRTWEYFLISCAASFRLRRFSALAGGVCQGPARNISTRALTMFPSASPELVGDPGGAVCMCPTCSLTPGTCHHDGVGFAPAVPRIQSRS